MVRACGGSVVSLYWENVPGFATYTDELWKGFFMVPSRLWNAEGSVYKYRMIFFFFPHHWLFVPPFKTGQKRWGSKKRSFTEKYRTRVYVTPSLVNYCVSALLFLDLLQARGVSRRHKYTSLISGDRAKYSQLSLFYKWNVVKICLVSYETFFSFFADSWSKKNLHLPLKKIIKKM